MQDSGLYRCEIKSPITTVSHSINVTVTGKKKSLAEKIHENQSIASPVADLPLPTYKSRESPHIKARTLPSQPPPVYDIPPVRVGSLRDHSSAGRHPVNRGPPRQCRDRGAVEEIEEENPLIYASLNHNTMPQRPQRIAHLQIEASEYAAIKVT
ncbi:hypothetical protein C0J50_14511 [Silurus asotus]|uniref:Uncharacterized protein n=1 Tax=Silurus asotus TaxID=30991 RepID=A0AAD5B286_SILAS|nr:hypothetical protein C0J50_14511 [Silurus asotus]